MKKHKILMSYGTYTDSKLVTLGASIKSSVLNNAYFTNIQTFVNAYVKAYDEYVSSIPARNIRNQINIAQKEARRSELLTEMDALAYSIMATARNDRSILEASGFNLNSESSKTPIPVGAQNVQVFVTNTPNTILVTCKHDKNARIYKARFSKDQKSWKVEVETSCKVLLKDVPAGVIVYVQMALKNSHGMSNWSNSIPVRLPLPGEPEQNKINI